MATGLCRFLYLPHDDAPLSADLPQRIAEALCNAGLVTGDATEPAWLQPAGTLKAWCRELGMRGVDVSVKLHDEPVEYGGSDLPPEGPYAACPRCGKVVSAKGVSARNPMTGAVFHIPHRRCERCRMPFDERTWSKADGPRRVLSRLVVEVSAEAHRRNHPSLHDGCPELVSRVNEQVGSALAEHYEHY